MSKLKTFRKARNITQAEIAELCGVAQNTISNWESGRQKISIEYIKKIAEHYNINPILLDESYTDDNGFSLISLAYSKDDNKFTKFDEFDFAERHDELSELINNLLMLNDEDYKATINLINKLLLADKSNYEMLSNLISAILK